VVLDLLGHAGVLLVEPAEQFDALVCPCLLRVLDVLLIGAQPFGLRLEYG
jgi:hypothetical protein